MPKKANPPKNKLFAWDLSEIPPYMCWNRIKSLRKNAGLTQFQVCVETSISVATLVALEGGNDTHTTDITKQKFADFFGCQVSDIFPVSMIGSITEKVYLERKLKEDKEDGQIPENTIAENVVKPLLD